MEENKAMEAIKEGREDQGITIDATGNDNSVEYPAATIDEISPTNLLRSAIKD